MGEANETETVQRSDLPDDGSTVRVGLSRGDKLVRSRAPKAREPPSAHNARGLDPHRFVRAGGAEGFGISRHEGNFSLIVVSRVRRVDVTRSLPAHRARTWMPMRHPPLLARAAHHHPAS